LGTAARYFRKNGTPAPHRGPSASSRRGMGPGHITYLFRRTTHRNFRPRIGRIVRYARRSTHQSKKKCGLFRSKVYPALSMGAHPFVRAVSMPTANLVIYAGGDGLFRPIAAESIAGGAWRKPFRGNIPDAVLPAWSISSPSTWLVPDFGIARPLWVPLRSNGERPRARVLVVREIETEPRAECIPALETCPEMFFFHILPRVSPAILGRHGTRGP